MIMSLRRVVRLLHRLASPLPGHALSLCLLAAVGCGFGGSVSAPLPTAANNPVPVIISASNTLLSGTSYTLDVYGSSFVSTSVIQVGGSNQATTFLDSTHLQTVITSSSITSGVHVGVVTPAAGGGSSNSMTVYRGDAYAEYPLAGTYLAPATSHPYVLTNQAREIQFLKDALTDTSKAAALTSLENYVKANLTKAITWETVYDGNDLFLYQQQFSVFDNGVDANGNGIASGAAPVASRFALYAYLAGLNQGYGNAALAAQATVVANTILYNWAVNGFIYQGAYLNSYAQFIDSQPGSEYPGQYIELQIGRGMNDYIAAEDVIFNTQTAAQQLAITAFIQRQEALVLGAFNFYYDYNYGLTCGRYNNQPSTGMESLALMGRFLGDQAMIQSLAGSPNTRLRWTFPQQVEGTIYGTNDTVRQCYGPPTTAAYRYNTVAAAGEIVDRYRNEGPQPFGYTGGNLTSLELIARVLTDAGYQPAAFVGGRGQSLQTAIDYYSYYLVNFLSYNVGYIPAVGSGYDAYPDFAQYAGDLYTAANGASITGAADITTIYVLGQNLYPNDSLNAAALAHARALAAQYKVVPFYAMGDMTTVEAWDP